MGARAVRFDGWQATHAGEREVKKALRQTLCIKTPSFSRRLTATFVNIISGCGEYAM
jgi:hypothetical protein